MTDQAQAPDLDRIRERRKLVIELRKKKPQESDLVSNSRHLNEPVMVLVRALRAERDQLTEELISGLRVLLKTTADEVTKALGLTEQQAAEHSSAALQAVQGEVNADRRKQSLHAKEPDPQFEINALDRAIAAHRDLLRWIQQAQPEPEPESSGLEAYLQR